MEKRRWCDRLFAPFVPMGLIFATALSFCTVPAYAGDTISAECYLKVNGGYEEKGSVDADDPSKAAVSCNNAYANCKGKCIGCYIDEDAEDEEDEICYDSAGKRVQR